MVRMSKNRWLGLVSCLLLGWGMSSSAAVNNVIDFPDGSVLEYGASTAMATNWFRGNGTVKLMGDANGGLFTLDTILIATNGTLTVDATEVNCRGIRWSKHVYIDGAGSLVVKGTDYIEFGESSASGIAYSSTDLAYFRAAPTFVDAEGQPVEAPAGITFTNAVVFSKKPACAWRIAPKCWFWPNVQGALGTPGTTLEITDYNLGIVNVNAIAADTVKVGSGCALSCRPCSVFWQSGVRGQFWKWGGSEATWPCNVVLDGGTFYSISTPVFTLDGSLTGTGTVQLRGTKGVTILGEVDLTNDLQLYVTNLVLGAEQVKATIAQKSSPVTVSFLQDTAYLAGLVGKSGTLSRLQVANGQALTVGSLAGPMSVLGGTNASVMVQRLAADAQVYVGDGLTFRVAENAATTPVSLTNYLGTASWAVSGPATGERVTMTIAVDETVAALKLTLGGKLDVTGVPEGLVELTIAADADVAGAFPATAVVNGLGGTWRNTTATWQNKVALWCDASQTNTFTYVGELNPGLAIAASNPNKIFWWYDCRPEHQDYALAMSRFKTNETSTVDGVKVFQADRYPMMYPSVETNILNGKAILKCSCANNTRLGVLNPTEKLQQRWRLTGDPRYDGIPSQYAIVLARNVNSDGRAILSSDGMELQATGKGCTAGCFSNATLTVYKNGTRLENPAATPWGKSEWAIYSFTTDGAVVNGLATSCEPGQNDAGGFDYAEILVFAEMPTEDERKVVEEYLSEKWGLAISHANTVVMQDQVIQGTGETTLNMGTRLTGYFAGTIDLNGQRLEIPDARLPLTAAEMPSEERILWIDPSCADSIVRSSDPAKPLEVAGVYQRDNQGSAITNGTAYYCQSAYSENGVTNRRPHTVVSAAGITVPALTWLDFSEVYGGDGYVNNLMFCYLPYRTPAADYANQTTKISNGGWYAPVGRSFFAVLDTRRGGGSPLCSQAGGGTGKRSDIGGRGKSPSVTDPIWGPGSGVVISNGTTRLDGVDVNGATQGFSGRPEVLTFQTASGESDAVSVKALAMLNAKGTQQEILGELLFFNTQLVAEVRADIEAYLMKKWLGKMRIGYQDFRDMTVTGVGTLVTPTFKAMPQLSAGFTGDVAVTTNDLTFTFAAGATTANEAVNLGATAVTLPAEVTVNLAFAQTPEAGVYTLFSANLQAGTTFTLGTVAGFSRLDRLSLKWDADAKALQAVVRAKGTMIYLR